MADYSNFVKINEATLAFCKWSLPSIEACFKQWHRSKQQTLPTCQQTSPCPSFRKPSKKSGACQSCIDWGDAVKAECYPPGGDPQWRNIDASLLHRDPVEVAKGFAFIIPSGQRHTCFDDFDIGGILKIMTGFKPYHQSDQCWVDKIKKVSDIRNSLSHMALKQNMQISDVDTGEYFRTIEDVATYLQGNHQCLKNDIFAALHNIYKSDITNDRFDKALRLLQQEFHQHKHELEQSVESNIRKTVREELTKQQKHHKVETENLISKLAEDLKETYKSTYCKKQASPWQPDEWLDLDHIFVPLTIENTVSEGFVIKEYLKSYDDVFQTSPDSRRFFLEGNPGHGKSVFCAKIANDWSKGQSPALKDIKLVFILQLGQITNEINIEDAIQEQLLSKDIDITNDNLSEILHELGDSCLIVFDSFDEAESNLMTNSHKVGNIVKTIQYQHLRQCYVLLKSRPWRQQEITTRYSMYKTLQLKALSRYDVLELVRKYFSRSKDYQESARLSILGKRLSKLIENNLVFANLDVPLTVLMVAWYFEMTDGKDIPTRLGVLYLEVFNKMCEKLGTIQVEHLIMGLGENAMEGLTPTKTSLVFEKSDFSQDVFRDACDAGILCEKHQRGKWQFFHKSIQEFCAGYFLSKHKTRLTSYLKGILTKKDALSVHFVLTFAAGSSSRPAPRNVLKRVLSLKSAASKIVKSLLRLFDAVSLKRFYSEELPLEQFNEIQQLIELCLVCQYESQSDLNLQLLFPSRRVLFYGISTKAANALGYLMQNHKNKPYIKELKLRPVAHASNAFNSDGPTGIMWRNNLQQLSIVGSEELTEIKQKFIDSNPNTNKSICKMAPSAVAAYISCIQVCEGMPSTSETNLSEVFHNLGHVRLEFLDVNHYQLHDNFHRLCEGIKEGHLSRIKTLYAQSTVTSRGQITELASRLHMIPGLANLDLSNNPIEPRVTIPTLCKNISKHKYSNSLNVSNLQAPAEDMVELVANVPSRCNQLNISGNEMNDDVASCLADTLSSRLKCLFFGMSNIGRTKHDEVLSVIHTRLKQLELLDVRESNYPVSLLAHAAIILKSAAGLHALNVHTCKPTELIDDQSCSSFIEACNQSSSIKTLRMSRIGLTLDQFRKLLETCKRKSMRLLSFSRMCLPEGYEDILADLEPDFLILL